jgi:hypothetical protein
VADIILLLISADFVQSNYCYEVEANRALQLHKEGRATVIPVVLRPVDFKGLPLAELQMLPSGALPITNWTRQDDGFQNVAEGVREAVRTVVERRVHDLSPNARTSLSEARALDAAIAREIPVGEYREVLSLIRVTESEGLRFELSQDEGTSRQRRAYSCTTSDVLSEDFPARYAVSAAGDLVSPEYQMSIYAPDLVVEDEQKKFVLDPRRDSRTFKFFVKAEREGEFRLRVNLHSKGLNTAEGLLSTAATNSNRPGGGGLIASVELVVRARTRAASASASFSDGRSF